MLPQTCNLQDIHFEIINGFLTVQLANGSEIMFAKQLSDISIITLLLYIIVLSALLLTVFLSCQSFGAKQVRLSFHTEELNGLFRLPRCIIDFVVEIS